MRTAPQTFAELFSNVVFIIFPSFVKIPIAPNLEAELFKNNESYMEIFPISGLKN